MERGWSLLNYALRLNPEILKINQYLHQHSPETAINTILVLVLVLVPVLLDQQHQKSSCLFWTRLKEQQGKWKNQVQTKAILKRRRQQELKNNNIKLLAMASRKHTSGILGVSEHYYINSDVRDALSNYYEKERGGDQKKEWQRLQIKVRKTKNIWTNNQCKEQNLPHC